MKKATNYIVIIIFQVVIFAALILFLKAESLVFSIGLLVVLAAALFFLRKEKRLYEVINTSLTGSSRRVSIASFAILIVLLPFFFLKSGYILHVLTFALIYIIAALGLNFQIGS